MRAASLAAALALLAVPGTAGAAPQGSLTFDPGSGLDTTRVRTVTSAPCPAATTNMVAVAHGRGFPAEGQVVVTNNDIDFSRTAPFVAPMTDTMAGFAADNGTALSGPYRITLRCIDVTTTKTYASFTGVVTFRDAHHWTAPRPSRTVAAQVLQGQRAGLGTALSAPAKGSAAGPAASPPAAGGAAAGTAGGTTAQAAAGTSRGGEATPLLWYLALSVAGTGLVAFALSTWRRERRETHGRAKAAS